VRWIGSPILAFRNFFAEKLSFPSMSYSSYLILTFFIFHWVTKIIWYQGSSFNPHTKTIYHSII